MTIQLMPPHGPGYRVSEVVRMTGMTERTVRRWLAQGRLPYHRVAGMIYVPVEAVEALFDGGER